MPEAFRREWQGEAHVDLKDSRMEGLNFQQLVQQAVERSSDVKAQETTIASRASTVSPRI